VSGANPVVVKPTGAQSSTPEVRLTATLPAGAAVTGATVLGTRAGDPADPTGADALRFAPVCASSATCATGGSSTSVTFRLPLTTAPASEAARNASLVLRRPGTYAFVPTLTTTDGDVSSAAAAAEVRYVRATRITGFDAAPEPVRAGRRATLTGVVTKAVACPTDRVVEGCRAGRPGRWAPVKSGEVKILFDPAGPGKARVVATVRTDRQGRFTMRLRPPSTGVWSAERAATDTLAQSRSATDRLRVRG
jgi:hypothetical protein